MKEALLPQEKLKSLLHYDHATGVFTQLKARKGVRVGEAAGTVGNKGYIAIELDGKKYYAHRLAWLYVKGIFPSDQIDHINRIKTDNRIGNLRLANNAENHQNMPKPRNNTSGYLGVFWRKDRQKWIAQIKINDQQLYLGIFSDLTEAIAARKSAEIKYHIFQHNQGNKQ